MSDAELIGKFGEQYKIAKGKLRSLQSEAQHYAEGLGSLRDFLSQMSGQPFSQIDTANKLKNYPSKEDLTQLLDALATNAREMELAEKELKRLGVL
ncbi:MAG TPA: hypothetical protein VN937_18165 [Blastocatellia bacterium]|nr:hypothetical protein [Blastocatellia bacterium]